MLNQKSSQALSYVFHPMLMPTLTFSILYFFLPNVVRPLSLVILPFLFFTTFIIPFLSVMMMKVLGQIQSLKMEDRQERITPFLYVTVFYAITAYMFVFRIHANIIISTIFISTCLLLAVLTLITLKYKISIHAAGMCGVTGYLLALALKYPDTNVFYPLLVMIICSGLVMSARLFLGAHKFSEIVWGAVVGIGICFIGLVIII